MCNIKLHYQMWLLESPCQNGPIPWNRNYILICDKWSLMEFESEYKCFISGGGKQNAVCKSFAFLDRHWCGNNDKIMLKLVVCGWKIVIFFVHCSSLACNYITSRPCINSLLTLDTQKIKLFLIIGQWSVPLVNLPSGDCHSLVTSQ